MKLQEPGLKSFITGRSATPMRSLRQLARMLAKKSFSTTLDSVSAAGTKAFSTKLSSLSLCLAALLILSPQLTAQSEDENTEETNLSDYEYVYEDDYDYDGDGNPIKKKKRADAPQNTPDSPINEPEKVSEDESFDRQSTGFQITGDVSQLKGKFFIDTHQRAHPLSTYPFSTQRLLMYAKIPDDSRLKACDEEFTKLGESVRSREGMLSAQAATSGAVQQNPTFYHWCFYNTIGRINQDLENSERVSSISNLATRFTFSMKGLWVLARSLEDATGEDRYFKFLRTRYIEVSEQYFARRLNILKGPLGGP